MRAMIVLGSLERGGAESVACELVRRWTSSAQCVVVSLRADGPMRAPFESAGATVYPGIARRRLSPLAPLRMARLMRRHGTNVLIVVDPLRNGLWYGLWGAMLAGRPATICWCHSSPHGQAGPFVPRLRMYRRLGLLDLVVCVSRHQRGELVAGGLPRRRVAVVANGLDLPAWSSAKPAADLPAGRRVVVSVANAMPDKDFVTLAGAMRRLAQRRHDVHLVLAGRGTDGPAVREAFTGLEGRVSFLGQRNDVPALLAGADALVLSSRSETFGMAVLEAMAAGVPVVTTDLPAVAELTGPDALVRVPIGDSPAMAEAIQAVLEDRAMSARLAAAGAVRAQRYDSDRMADRLARLARTAIRGGRR